MRASYAVFNNFEAVGGAHRYTRLYSIPFPVRNNSEAAALSRRLSGRFVYLGWALTYLQGSS
jgi:hypothetical protein